MDNKAGHFFYRMTAIISDVYKGLRHHPKVKAMTSYSGRDSKIQKISIRFFWHNIKGDVREYYEIWPISKAGKSSKSRANTTDWY